jgi:hypothetical protein
MLSDLYGGALYLASFSRRWEMPAKNNEGRTMDRMSGSKTLRAILTDVQFWVPAGVLAAGVLLLILLH